jgi:hypothetical protein
MITDESVTMSNSVKNVRLLDRSASFISGASKVKYNTLLKERHILYEYIHCKKRLTVFPSPAGMSLTKLSLAGKSLTSDTLAGDGKTANLFLQCTASRPAPYESQFS